MKERFKDLASKMPMRLKSLLEQPPITIDDIGITDMPQKGIYVFFEGNKPIYVGRSNRMKKRLKEHSQRSSDHYSATLAFRITKQEYLSSQTDIKRPTNKQLMDDSVFREKFEAAKHRIAKTQIRFIGIESQAEQAILEIYAALELNTEFNDFRTH